MVNRTISVLEAKDVPVPRSTAEITFISRQIRVVGDFICVEVNFQVLFDKLSFHSNVLPIRSRWCVEQDGVCVCVIIARNPDQPGTWKFTKGASFVGGFDDDNVCLVRARCVVSVSQISIFSDRAQDLSLLFELTVTARAVSGQIDEVHLPYFVFLTSR